MKKGLRVLLSLVLALMMITSTFLPVVSAADFTSEEYKFFNLLGNVNSGLTSAIQSGYSTGNWSNAKNELLNYYKDKFRDLNWINFNTENDGSYSLALYDSMSFSERFMGKQDVTGEVKDIEFALNGSVSDYYLLDTLVHSDAYGICMSSSESGNKGPRLVVTFNDGTSTTIQAKEDAYVRATGYGASNSNASTAWGTANPNQLWAMHCADKAHNMPYSYNEMRTYISFDLSSLSGKSIKNSKLVVNAVVKSPGTGAVGSGQTLPLMLFDPYCKTWSENTLTWNYLANQNALAHYSWDGLGGIVYNESLYGTDLVNLHVPSQFIQATSRFTEETSLCQVGEYTRAKEMLLRFAEQTYDNFANATVGSGGYPNLHPVGPANRSLEFPYIYKCLLDNNVLSAEENYRILRWYYQEIQYIYKDKSTNIFLNGGSTPNTTTNSYKDNFGAWHITALYNTFAFFGEFAESSKWQKMFEDRLALISSGLTNPDGSYVEVTLGYPVAVTGYYTNMLSYMGEQNYKSKVNDILLQKLINTAKYLMDCSYPDGKLPQYGDGNGGYVINNINRLLSIKGIEENTSEQLQNLIWYQSNGKRGKKPATSVFYKDAKLAIDRTGWASTDSMFFMNAKAGGIHTHHDALAILLYSNGRNLLEDTGTITYDHASPAYELKDRSNAHNTVEVDGAGQRVKGDTISGGYDGTADNIQFASNSSVSTVRAYTTSTDKITHYRNASYVKAFGGMIIVSDSLVPSDSKTHTYTQNWHPAPSSNPVVTTNVGSFTGTGWGYTNYASGANMMIAQGKPSSGTITMSTPSGYDDNSSSGKSDYFEFKQTASGKVSFNTAILPYEGQTKGIRTMKMDTGVSDDVASAMQIQIFSGSNLNRLEGEVAYYNSFETTPSRRTVFRRLDSDGMYNMLKTDASNAIYHVRLDENVDMAYMSNGTELHVYNSTTQGSDETAPLLTLNTSARVSDLTVSFDEKTGVVAFETSDNDIINGLNNIAVTFSLAKNINKVTLNGKDANVSINGNTVYYGTSGLFFDFTNDSRALSRYEQNIYGGGVYNYDTGNWTNRIGSLSFSSSGEGTMTAQVINKDGYDGFRQTYVQTSSGGSATCLRYNMANADIVQVKAKFHGLGYTDTTFARAVVMWQDTDSSYKWTYSDNANISFAEDEYIVINIPVSTGLKAVSNAATLRVEFNNLVQKNTDCYITYDYIYVGPSSSATNRDLFEVTFDNLFNFNEWKSSDKSNTLNFNKPEQNFSISTPLEKGDVKDSNGSITISTGSSSVSGGTSDLHTEYGTGQGYYFIPVEGNTEYKLSFDADIQKQAQCYVFIYNSSKQPITSDKIGGTKDFSNANAVIGRIFSEKSGRINLTFTTTDNTRYLQIRFGNAGYFDQTSVFSNIRLVKNNAFYDSITYKSTGKVYQFDELSGTLSVPTRKGYSFEGWYTGENGTGTKVTDSNYQTLSGNVRLYSNWVNKRYEITYDNLFNFGEWMNNDYSSVLNRPTNIIEKSYGTGELNAENGKITITTATESVAGSTDVRTEYGPGSSYYNIPVEPNTKYRLSFDLTTEQQAQCYVFIYNSSYKSITSDTRGGATFSSSAGYVASGFFNKSGKVNLDFTTTDHTAYVQLRLGNSGYYSQTSTFANIRLVKSTPYSEITYPSAGKVFTYNNNGGALATPQRAGYDFSGWYTGENGTGTKITDTNYYTLTDDTALYSSWTASKYTLTLDANDGKGTSATTEVTYGSSYGNLAAPENRTGFVFDGWYTEPVDGEKVNADTVVKTTGNHSVYAHWVHDTFVLDSASSFVYEADGKLLYGISPLTTQQDIINAFTNTNITVSDFNIIHTGVEAFLTDDTGTVYDTLTVVLFGDVNGDGWYDGMDSVLVDCIANQMLGEDALTAAQIYASDCNHDGVTDEFDVEILRQAGLLLQNIDQTKSSEELLTTSSAYSEYLNLILQNPPTEKPETPIEKSSIIDMIIDWITSVFFGILYIMKGFFRF